MDLLKKTIKKATLLQSIYNITCANNYLVTSKIYRIKYYFKMIPITKPSLDISDLRYIKKVIKSKILTDGYYQKKNWRTNKETY